MEAALIAILQYGFGWTALPCRVVSFPAALGVTWWFNHRYTFESRGGAGELLRYAGTQGLGLLTNLLVYTGLIVLVPALDRHALVPLVAGSAMGLLVNFALAKRLVFTLPRK